MYYIRRIHNRQEYDELVNEMVPDGISAKFIDHNFMDSIKNPATNEDSIYELSAWKCKSLEEKDIRESLKAALLSSSGIRNCWFAILPSEELQEAGIEIDATEPGKTGLKNGAQMHVNLKGLTYAKIGKLLSMYKESIEDPDIRKKYSEVRKRLFKELAEEAYQNEEIDEVLINPSLLDDIKRYAKTS